MKPNKFLGQNFLNSKKIIADIIRAADLKPDDVVLEVGPGKGILTEALLEALLRGKVIAIEKDKKLFNYLWTKFSDSIKVSKLVLINGDILKILNKELGIKNCAYKIVANIPYYITSHFLRKILESNCQPSRMVLMVQKEVAERIACPARRGSAKESILSISVKVYGEPKIIKKVPARYFSPAPKVDSAILLINNISKKFFEAMIAEKPAFLRTGIKGNPAKAELLGLAEERFFSVVKRGFSQKRKMLKNNLKLLNTECLIECGIKETARAEELSVENWRCLAKILN